MTPHKHKKKPKFTKDPADVDEKVDVFNKIVTEICDNKDFKKPLSVTDFRKMTHEFKFNFVKKNYEFFHESSINAAIRQHRLFAYLYDNCTEHPKHRRNVGYVVLKEVEQ